jgi:hypothetical protein
VDPHKTIDPTKTIDSQKTVIAPDAATNPREPVAAASSQTEVDKSASDPSDDSHATQLNKSAIDPSAESHAADLKAKIPSHWIGLWHMLQSPRAMTTMALTFLNGFIVGALQDTGMTLYLEEEYGLTSFGAGLVFLGFVVPTFFASPLAGWVRSLCTCPPPIAKSYWRDLLRLQLVDRWGTKWIMAFGTFLCIPMYPLLIIKGPLALFIFFLAVIGAST